MSGKLVEKTSGRGKVLPRLGMAAEATLLRFAVGTALAATAAPAPAMALATAHSANPWAAAHIEALPASVRHVVSRDTQACGGKLAAERDFTRYIASRNVQLIAVHYEHTNCRQRRSLCGEDGCLHQVFVSTGRGYRLVLSVRTGEIELKLIDKSPAVATECRFGAGCTRMLVWNGSRFVSPSPVISTSRRGKPR